MDVLLLRASCFNLYALLLLLFTYLLNQLDRFLLPVVNRPLAQDIHYGDIACFINTTLTAKERDGIICNYTNKLDCQATNGCVWDYTGEGMLYQLLAGPIFIVVYSFSGIPLSFAANVCDRRILLALSLMLWSLITILTGAVSTYWQLAVLRFGLGITEAGCTPFAASLISDYFDADLRASAIGFYNWGIYIGYSLAYLIGNFITEANILRQGWRWSFYLSGIPGILLGLLIIFTVTEPSHRSEAVTQKPVRRQSGCWHSLVTALRPFCQPAMLLLCSAGSVRNAAGYVWAYNTQPYFEAVGQPPTTIGAYMSWIPLVGGSIGVVSGGFISDRIVRHIGLKGRLFVLIVSQMLAVPFVAGALYLSAPYAYISLIPGYIIGEMWVGITLTVVVELVPPSRKTSAVAVYLFIITNIGGNVPLLLPPLKNIFLAYGFGGAAALRASLYILYPGLYLLGALLYGCSLCALPKTPSDQGYEEIPEDSDTESSRKIC